MNIELRRPCELSIRAFFHRGTYRSRCCLVLICLVAIVSAAPGQTPSISSISPATGLPGSSVTISGLNFTSTTGSVSFNGQTATISSWSNTSIVAVAPSGVTNGNVVVTAGGLSSNGVFFCSQTTGSGHVRPIGVDHRMVLNTDQTDFPLLITGTFSYLATVANGGYVQNSNGYDIVFTSDPAGQNKLDHEIDSYNAVSGNASFWVRIPTLSHTTDTSIYMWYGNSGVQASLENRPGVWRNGYAGVWHLSSNSLAQDSTGNNSGTVSSVTAGSGQVGGAGSFSGSTSSYVRVTNSTSFKPSASLTLEAWANPSSVTAWNKMIALDYRADGTWNVPFLAYSLAMNYNTQGLSFQVTNSGTINNLLSVGTIPFNSWSYVAATFDNSSHLQTLYINGSKDSSMTNNSSAIDYATSKDLTLGQRSPYSPGEGWNGLLDELRISTVARSADWIATQYNNQKSPAAYVIQCSETPSGTQPSACLLQVPPSTFNLSESVAFSHALVPNTDQTDFPVLISGAYWYLATVANGGKVQNANGWDIVFTSDAAGQNKLDHEIESYDGTIGKINFWVRVPTLSHSADTTIYMWYGSNAVQVSQDNPSGVWRNGYAGVWHLATLSGNNVSTIDSTGNNTGTPNLVTVQTGRIGGGAAFGSSSYVSVSNSTSYKPTAALTLEAWANPSNVTAWNKMIALDYRANGTWNVPFLAYALAMNYNTHGLSFQVTNSGTINNLLSVGTIPFNSWSHVAATFDNTSHLQTLYINGAQDSSMTNNSSAIDYGTSKDLTLGMRSPYSQGEAWLGSLDELRISTVARSADWIAAEYNNQNSPATFYTLGVPAVTISYPVAGSTVYLSRTVTLTVSAAPSPGATITKVQYFEGQTSLGTATISPFSLNIGVPSVGSHTYTAEITDSRGLQTFSSAVTATMANPKITAVTPSYGKAGTQVKITGVGFGATQAGAVPSFNGVPAAATGWNDGEIDSIVPSGAGYGQMGVSWPDGVGADGAPPFGPCSNGGGSPGAHCVTSIVPPSGVILGDGHTFYTTITVDQGAPNNGNTQVTISGYSWTCVPPAVFAPGGQTNGCSFPGTSFQISTNANGNGRESYYAYFCCGNDAGMVAYFTIVGAGQISGSTDLGPCKDCAQVGKPINVKTGNTYIQDSDYSVPGLGGGISITRTWNSQWASTGPLVESGMFGDSWRASYEDRIQTTSSGVNYWLDDGKVWRFSSNNGVYSLTSPVDAHGALTYDSTAQQYTLTFVNGTKKIFSSTGYLTQVLDRNGNTTMLTYDGSNHLTQVTAAGGQSVTFAYGDAGNPNQVTSITDSAGVIATYTYGSSSHLTNVTYADSSQINYSSDANGLITSVTDSQGKVLESHTYDGQRRGLTSQRANGVEAVSVSYPQSGISITLDSASHSSSYNYGQIGESAFIGSVSGPGCSTCGIRGFNQYTYDSNGNVTASFDSNGVPTLYSYDSNGNVTSRSTPLNGHLVTWQYTYNSFGEPLTATDPLGNVSTNTYDAKGNLLTVSTPAPDSNTAASVTTFTYDSRGELLTITDPLNNPPTTLAYYPTGLLHTITDAQNNVTTFNYDGRGNRTDVYDAMTPSNHTTFAYDGRNRLTGITNPDTSTVAFGYDYRGRRTSVTDGNGKITQYAYDDADRLTQVTDANTNATQYGYDLEDNLTSITDANTHTTSFQYDSQGHLTQTTFPSTRVETYSYDNVGNLLTKIDRKNQTISYAYDTLNRLTSKSYPDSTSVAYSYDDASRLTQVQDAIGTYSFIYDNMGRLKQTTTAYSFVSGNPFTMVYAYDAASNRKAMTDPNNGATTYTYDNLNRLSNILDFNNNNFGFSYDALGRRTQLTRPNGISTNYSYDSVSNLLSVLHQQGVTTLDGASYTYDSAGNRKSKTNLLNSATSNFSYDNIYQLTGVTGSNSESYTYDPVGNRLTSQNVATYSYNGSNELAAAGSASYTYDANGNTLTKTDSTGTTTYTWGFENRLISVQLPSNTTVTFKYDPFGRRIQKNGTSTTNYVYDSANVIEEVDSSGNLQAKYSQGTGIDEPLSELRSGTTSFYEQDGLGSVTSLSSNGGTLANTYIYDSFGNLTASTGTITNPYQYTGRDYDPDTGLRYYRARYYDPVSGRFLSEDPIGLEGGDNNAYRYVTNDPTTFLDPTGELEMSHFIKYKKQSTWDTIVGNAGETTPHIYWEAKCVCIGKGQYQAKIWFAFTYNLVYHTQSTKEHELRHVDFAVNFWNTKWNKYAGFEKIFKSKKECDAYAKDQIQSSDGWFAKTVHADFNEMDANQRSVDDWFQRLFE